MIRFIDVPTEETAKVATKAKPVHASGAADGAVTPKPEAPAKGSAATKTRGRKK